MAAETKTVESIDEVTESRPPSHILQDGKFVYLPEPTAAERSQFLQRAITKYKLLTDLKDDKPSTEEKSGPETTADETEPVMHPLAKASIRLQTLSVQELGKAIQMNTLINSNEFFSLSNIVNPLLGEGSSETQNAAAKGRIQEQEQRLRAEYLGKRKRSQFLEASRVLSRHQHRLAAALATQQIVDRRYREIRPRWKMAAPEHGIRAKAHPVHPTETVAIDVDVYNRDASIMESPMSESQRTGIARRVPRYAILEVPEKAKVDVDAWKTRHDPKLELVDTTSETEMQTKAEPYAVADPTLGKIDVDFDPDKVPMLTLQVEIEKGSTGYKRSACLEPSLLGVGGKLRQDDEQTIVALQHSLFCASLFESIRTELDSTQKVWLSADMEVNFLPGPALLAGDESMGGLSMVHCHEGEVKVQLDSEYSLAVKLVEAQGGKPVMEEETLESDPSLSGSQTPAHLYALCRALLLQAQTVYHQHSIGRLAEKVRKAKTESDTKSDGHLRRKKADEESETPAHILQSCVGLGAKMILERKLRKALSRVNVWASDLGLTIDVEWLPLSVFELASYLVVSCKDLIVDVTIDRQTLIVESCNSDSQYRRVEFYSAEEFEIYLRVELRQRRKQE